MAGEGQCVWKEACHKIFPTMATTVEGEEDAGTGFKVHQPTH